ncbi:MAG: hypothetical protein H7336_15355 [Bacteriovorax sp.]|nr:hypothetical protein [Bacteriovorax sp.]
MLNFLTGFLLLFLFGCSDMYQQQSEPPPAQAPIIRVKSLAENQIKSEYIAKESANKYDVLVSWPPFEGHVKILDNKKIINEETTAESSFLIKDVEGGLDSTFDVETYDPEKGLTKEFKLIVKPPKDLVFNGDVYLTSDLTNTAARVFINDNSSIYTMNFNLDLNFTKLYVGSNSKIQSFPTGSKAGPSQSGRSAGNVRLQGQKIIGDLTMNMNSEAGGNGLTGEILCRGGWIISKCEGGPGGNSGALGIFTVELEDWTDFSFNPTFERSPGGTPGGKFSGNLNGVCVAEPSNSARLDKTCAVPATVGAGASGGSICIKYGAGAAYECKN